MYFGYGEISAVFDKIRTYRVMKRPAPGQNWASSLTTGNPKASLRLAGFLCWRCLAHTRAVHSQCSAVHEKELQARAHSGPPGQPCSHTYLHSCSQPPPWRTPAPGSWWGKFASSNSVISTPGPSSTLLPDPQVHKKAGVLLRFLDSETMSPYVLWPRDLHLVSFCEEEWLGPCFASWWCCHSKWIEIWLLLFSLTCHPNWPP